MIFYSVNIYIIAHFFFKKINFLHKYIHIISYELLIKNYLTFFAFLIPVQRPRGSTVKAQTGYSGFTFSRARRVIVSSFPWFSSNLGFPFVNVGWVPSNPTTPYMVCPTPNLSELISLVLIIVLQKTYQPTILLQ